MSPYNITLNDTSPLVSYSGNWQSCFDISGCVPAAAGAYGSGQGYHDTSGEGGASITLNFYGSEIHLYGDASSPLDLSFIFDNATIQPVITSTADSLSTLVTSFSSSAAADHVLTIGITGPFNFSSAVVVVPSLATPPTTTTLQYWSPSISYSGSWIIEAVEGLSNGTASTNAANASASLEFSGTGVVVFSTLDGGHGPYSVTLNNDTYQYSASGIDWLIPESVIFYQAGLDPTITHTLVLVNNPAEDSDTFTLNEITILQPASSESSPLSVLNSPVNPASSDETSTEGASGQLPTDSSTVPDPSSFPMSAGPATPTASSSVGPYGISLPAFSGSPFSAVTPADTSSSTTSGPAFATSPSVNASSRSRSSIILGGAIGGVVMVFLGTSLLILRWHRKRRTSGLVSTPHEGNFGGIEGGMSVNRSSVVSTASAGDVKMLTGMDRLAGAVPGAITTQGLGAWSREGYMSYQLSVNARTSGTLFPWFRDPAGSSMSVVEIPTSLNSATGLPHMLVAVDPIRAFDTAYDEAEQKEVVDRLVELIAARLDPAESGENSESAEMEGDMEQQHEVVDRLAALLASRIDPRASGLSGVHETEPPRYVDQGSTPMR